MAEEKPRVRKHHMVDENGYARDLWPDFPTREECIAVGFPTSFEKFAALERLWPAMTVEDKEALGFTRVFRAMQIERLIAEHGKGKQK